jgi:hypothetical protein
VTRSPIVAGLSGACILLGIVGLFRAVAEFGHAGFVAFLWVLFWPVALVATAIFISPHFNNGLLSELLPSKSSFKRLAYAVAIAGVLGAAYTGLFGIGWLVN